MVPRERYLWISLALSLLSKSEIQGVDSASGDIDEMIRRGVILQTKSWYEAREDLRGAVTKPSRASSTWKFQLMT